MDNWTIITEADLRGEGFGTIIDKAKLNAGDGVDPVAKAIANAVSEVRGSVSVSCGLDADPAKVPNSLKGLTLRKAIWPLMRLIRLAMSQDDKDQAERDEKRLRQVEAKEGAPVEEPDSPAGSAEMQQSNSVGAVNVPRRQTGRDLCSGL